MAAALHSFPPHHDGEEEEEEEEEEEIGKEVTNPKQTLNYSNPRQNRYTLMTQNGQPHYKWPFPPFIVQGGECLTMWDLFPPFYFPIHIP